MKSQSISFGRHATIRGDCVEAEKVPRIKRALPDLPGTGTRYHTCYLRFNHCGIMYRINNQKVALFHMAVPVNK